MDPELVEKIKVWLQMDSDIATLSNQLKEKKREKKEMTDALMATMKSKEIEVVNLNDGRIELKSNKTKKPLSTKLLKECLQQCLQEKDKVDEIFNYIQENRAEQQKECIKRISKVL
jgi:Family of unknown function (DUF5760)